MKKFVLLTTMFLATVAVHAQWDTSGSNIYNTNSGYVGIGTTTPNSKLDLGNGYGSNGVKLLIYNDNSSSELAGTKCGFYMDNFRPNNLNLVFPEASANPGLFTISAKNTSGTTLNPYFSVVGLTGNVGIGTTSPGGKLDINAGSQYAIRTLTASRYVVEVRNTSDTDGGWWLVNDPNGSFALHENSIGDQLTIKPGGYVGVGTTSPSQRMHVSGSNAHHEVAARIENTDTNNDSFAPIQFKTGSSPNVWQTFARNGDLFSGIASVADYMVIKNGGNVGIGTSSPSQKLTVNGTIYGKEVKVDLSVPGPDYVFEKDYQLPSLEEIKTYIDQNKHLPEVPSATDMEKNGINLGEMNMLLLKKVEELTLYVIEQNKRMDDQQLEIKELKTHLHK